MAFTPDTLSAVVQSIGGTGIRMFTYMTDDTIETVTGTDYFVRGKGHGLRTSDLIFVSPVTVDTEPYTLVIETIDADGNATAGVSDPTAKGVPDIGDDSSWMGGRPPAIIERATPKFLMPEMYIGLETQAIYSPGDDDYDGTDWSPAFEAMHEEMRERAYDSTWPPTGVGVFRKRRHASGVALQPGHRYRVSRSVPMWGLDTYGYTLQGNGATICLDYSGGKAGVDWLGSSGWNISDLGIESTNDAIPDMLALIGSPASGVQAVDMNFRNCRFIGWARKVGLYNYCAEVSSWVGGEISTLAPANTAPSAYFIDANNSLDVGAYSNHDAVTATVGLNQSCVEHYIAGCTLRTQTQGTVAAGPGAALKLHGAQGGELTSCRNVEVRSVYMLNTRGSGSLNHPAILVKGEVPLIDWTGHAELSSHNILFDKSWGNYNHRGLRIRGHNENPSVSIIGASNDDAQYVNIADLDLHVSRSHVGTANLFDPNHMAASVVTGKVFHGGVTAALNNYAAIQRFEGDIGGYLTGAQLGQLSAGSRARLLAGNAADASRGYLKRAYKTMLANGALAVDDVDDVYLGGSVTAVSAITNGNRFSAEFSIINTTAGNVDVTGLEGGVRTIATMQVLNVKQLNDKFYA